MTLRTIIVSLLVAVPLTAHAMGTIEWNFEGEVPGQWDVHMFTGVTPRDDGLYIPANEEGYIVTKTNFEHSPDAVALTFQTEKNIEAVLMWRDPSISTEGYVTFPFIIEGQSDTQMIDIDLSTSPVWKGFPTEFGIGFPKGSDVLLKKIEFFHWNRVEKLWHGFLSFWKFDIFRSHSINFLWGPWLTFNPIARADMHMMSPPLGTSGMWIFYALLAVGGIICFVKRKRKQTLTLFLLIFAGLWLFYDARMGTELLSYVRNDWRDTILKDVGERTLRAHHNILDVADLSIPTITKEPYYLFVGPKDSAYYFSEMRYRTYPVLPVQRGKYAELTKYGLIFGRNDVFFDKEGLKVDGELVRPGEGTVIEQYDEYSALIQFN